MTSDVLCLEILNDTFNPDMREKSSHESTTFLMHIAKTVVVKTGNFTTENCVNATVLELFSFPRIKSLKNLNNFLYCHQNVVDLEMIRNLTKHFFMTFDNCWLNFTKRKLSSKMWDAQNFVVIAMILLSFVFWENICLSCKLFRLVFALISNLKNSSCFR